MQGMRVAAEPPFRTSLCYRVHHDTKWQFVSPASSWSCSPKSPTDDNKAANKIFINKKLSGFSENIQSLLLAIWKIPPARAEP